MSEANNDRKPRITYHLPLTKIGGATLAVGVGAGMGAMMGAIAHDAEKQADFHARESITHKATAEEMEKSALAKALAENPGMSANDIVAVVHKAQADFKTADEKITKRNIAASEADSKHWIGNGALAGGTFGATLVAGSALVGVAQRRRKKPFEDRCADIQFKEGSPIERIAIDDTQHAVVVTPDTEHYVRVHMALRNAGIGASVEDRGTNIVITNFDHNRCGEGLKTIINALSDGNFVFAGERFITASDATEIRPTINEIAAHWAEWEQNKAKQPAIGIAG